MSKSPPTRASLLIRLRNADDTDAWHQFVEIYAPLVADYGRHRGLQDADASDLAQEVLQAVAGAAGRFDYDPRKGSFRGWLFTVSRNKMLTMIRRNSKRDSLSGGTEVRNLVEQQADPRDEEEHWNRQHQLHLFRWALQRIEAEFRPKTWQAFQRTAIQQESANDVAKELGISVGAVYIAKSRILARIRTEIESIEDEAIELPTSTA